MKIKNFVERKSVNKNLGGGKMKMKFFEKIKNKGGEKMNIKNFLERKFVKFSAIAFVFALLGIAMVVGGNVIVKDGQLNVTGTSSNSTFDGDVTIKGTLYGGTPLEISGGINLTSGNITDNSGKVLTIPSGMIVMFDTDCPSDWTRLTALDGKFLVGGATYNTSAGGSDSVTLAEANLPSHSHGDGTLAADSDGAHSHTASVVSAEDPLLGWIGAGASDGQIGPISHGCQSIRCSKTLNFDTDLSATVNEAGAHTHTISGSTGSTGSGTSFDNRPAYATIVICKKD